MFPMMQCALLHTGRRTSPWSRFSSRCPVWPPMRFSPVENGCSRKWTCVCAAASPQPIKVWLLLVTWASARRPSSLAGWLSAATAIAWDRSPLTAHTPHQNVSGVIQTNEYVNCQYVSLPSNELLTEELYTNKKQFSYYLLTDFKPLILSVKLFHSSFPSHHIFQDQKRTKQTNKKHHKDSIWVLHYVLRNKPETFSTFWKTFIKSFVSSC